MGKKDGQEYILAEENMYFLEKLEKFGYQFGSEEERKADNITRAREEGYIINFFDETVDTTAWRTALEEEKEEESNIPEPPLPDSNNWNEEEKGL